MVRGEDIVVIGNRKKVLFNIVPYEYRSLELYLEKMALKGWKFEDIQGEFLNFVKIDPAKIRYWVDINGTNPIRNIKDTIKNGWTNKLEWNLTYSYNKIDIYSREDGVEEFFIPIDEEEKFKDIVKLSLKNILMTLITVFLLALTTLSDEFVNLIANDDKIIMLIITTIIIVYQLTHITSFVTWYIKGLISIRRNDKVSYKVHWLSKIRIVINTVVIITGITALIYLGIFTPDNSINDVIGIGVILLLIAIIVDLSGKNSGSVPKKRRIDIFNIIGLVLLISILLGRNYIHKDTNHNNYYNLNKELNLTLEDFNDKSVNSSRSYIQENKGILASELWFYDEGSNGDLYYNLFESNYKWIVDKYLDYKIKWINNLESSKVEKVNYNKDVTLYKLEERNFYMLVSKNKVIYFINLNYRYDKDEFFNIIYEEVFLNKN